MTLSPVRIAALTLGLAMLPAAVILQHFRKQEPIPDASSWIPLPKVSMDAGDWEVRSKLHGVQQFGLEDVAALADECGNPRRPARLERYGLTFIPPFGAMSRADIVPTDDGVDITYREESRRPTAPADDRRHEALVPAMISEYHFSAERSRQLQIAFANPEAWGLRTQQAEHPYSCMDCATSVLEACIRGRYAVAISEDAHVAAKVWSLLHPESRKSTSAK